MAIYYRGKQVQRLQNVAKGASQPEDLYLVEIGMGKTFSVPMRSLTADRGEEEIILTEKLTKGNHIQPMLPLIP